MSDKDLRFLREHLPPRDRDVDLEENVRLARAVRDETPCGMEIPEEIYREYVLPHRFLDEAPCDWRAGLFERYAELARRAASIEDAVSTLNRRVFEDYGVTFHATRRPFDNMNVEESRACGMKKNLVVSVFNGDSSRSLS